MRHKNLASIDINIDLHTLAQSKQNDVIEENKVEKTP